MPDNNASVRISSTSPYYTPSGSGTIRSTASSDVTRPNTIVGHVDNAIASDLASCTISGGGQDDRENVIGAASTANVGTANSNLPTAAGTGADYSTIAGGYDNVANGLASVILSNHSLTEAASTHGTIIGGSTHEVTDGDYGTVIGGTNNAVSGTGATCVGGSNSTVSGDNATALGTTHTVSGVSSFVAGQGNTVSGIAAVAIGRDLTASGDYAHARGRDAKADQFYEDVFAGGKFSAQGDAQVMRFVLRRQTTNATPTVLGIGGAASNPQIPTDTTWAFRYLVVARRTDADNESAAYTATGVIDRQAGSAALVAAVTPAVISEDTAAWDVTVAAAGSGGLQISATGEAAKTINWVAYLEIVAVTG